MTVSSEVSPRSSLRERLRQATRALHQQVEGIVALEERVGSRDDYRDLLARLLGLYRPVEAALARLDWDGTGIDYAERRKVPLLEADLVDLGVDPAHLAGLPSPAVPPVRSVPAGLGWLYVLEGSTLGGQLILRRARAALGVGDAFGGRFFSGYGPRTGAMWRACVVALDRVPTPSREAAEVEAAAVAMFGLFERWLGEPRATRQPR